MNRAQLLILTLLIAGLGACARGPVHVTVAELMATPTPPPQDESSPLPEGVPAGSRLLQATVTDVRLLPELLVELTDPGGISYVWAAGFPQAPQRGSTVWTAIVGPPAENDLVGAVYPSTGPLPEPATGGLTRQGTLAVTVGAFALITGLGVGIATQLGGSRHRRRCAGCGQGAEESWITCAACGHSLVSLEAAHPAAPEIVEAQPADPPLASEPPPPSPPAEDQSEPAISSNPTIIRRSNDPSWPT